MTTLETTVRQTLATAGHAACAGDTHGGDAPFGFCTLRLSGRVYLWFGIQIGQAHRLPDGLGAQLAPLLEERYAGTLLDAGFTVHCPRRDRCLVVTA